MNRQNIFRTRLLSLALTAFLLATTAVPTWALTEETEQTQPTIKTEQTQTDPTQTEQLQDTQTQPTEQSQSNESQTNQPQIDESQTVPEDDPNPELWVKTASATSVTLKWTREDGAKKYIVYRSTKKNKGYKKIAETAKTSYKNKTLKENKTYYYKVRYKAGGSTYESNLIRKMKVMGNYKSGTVYGPYLDAKERNQVKNAVAKFVNMYIQPGTSDFDKAGLAHDYLAYVCEYAPTWEKNEANTAWGALIYGEAQCSGYARAYKALCDGMGVKCYYVHANKKASNPSHQWNIVKVAGRYYHIDVQCNDSSGFYAIFLASDKTVKQTVGMRWNTSDYPKCPKDYFE